ncbi:SP_1767 family glycosyltransferase [Priestia aryabhattai]|uniref:SP_1767 family glycosyltransferase n=1 Tax=Priestia TaxID=2800373 RepID=UPI000BFA0D3A|nr:SP_1767 family glycosyltransferase [Priestia aryabhattai]MED3951899.1 SP_1767 family glycosyltransferase [Priestia aryabhattai]MED4393075.1 SP_1767 family glycosyltransferase [Priestia aryabhattai]PGA19856.1 glycosyl transferase family 8 [Priestia aryabhattai]
MKKHLLEIYYIILKLKDFKTIVCNHSIAAIVKPPLVKSTDETLSKIINDKCSVSRFGDGEFSLIYGKSLLFQPYSAELSSRLKDILKSNQKNHIVCIPNVFKNLDWCMGKPKKYWEKYLSLNLSNIFKILDKEKVYYDSLVTRIYIDHIDKSKAENRFKQFKKIWNKREIIIVEGQQSRLGVGNDFFNNAALIERIVCPATNAFEKYEEVLKRIKEHDKTKLILIALGPTATVLAHDLSMEGYEAIDIGHIDIEYDWFLKKAVEKEPVESKYIGEITGGTEVKEVKDQKYEDEIITRIV